MRIEAAALPGLVGAAVTAAVPGTMEVEGMAEAPGFKGTPATGAVPGITALAVTQAGPGTMAAVVTEAGPGTMVEAATEVGRGIMAAAAIEVGPGIMDITDIMDTEAGRIAMDIAVITGITMAVDTRTGGGDPGDCPIITGLGDTHTTIIIRIPVLPMIIMRVIADIIRITLRMGFGLSRAR